MTTEANIHLIQRFWQTSERGILMKWQHSGPLMRSIMGGRHGGCVARNGKGKNWACWFLTIVLTLPL